MSDRKPTVPGTPPGEDIAKLYSWANLHGAKYRDFSDSRQEARAQNRTRVLVEQAKAQQEMEDAAAASAVAEESISGELPEEAPEVAELRQAFEHPLPVALAPPPPPPVERQVPSASIPEAVPQQRAQEKSRRTESVRPQESPKASDNLAWLSQNRAAARTEAPGPAVAAAPVASAPSPARASAAVSAAPARAAEQQSVEAPSPSQEQLASRWSALRGIFEQNNDARRRREPMQGRKAPVLAVFSLAGGTGKTSLVATLGRALAARGERVLLAETSAWGLLPYYFGANEVRPGAVRTFSGGAADAPISVVSLDGDGAESADPEWMQNELGRAAGDAGRILVDVGTASMQALRGILRMSPTVLVPVVPDMNSILSLQALDALFRNHKDASGTSVQPFYVLNQVDTSLPLHLDMCEALRQQLGERLLPFVLPRAAEMSEALAEGMTVVDYGPQLPVTEACMHLSGWIRSISVPGTIGSRGARWSEQ
jgi:cellulose synthase operon protein YhjQ